jgi:hypothetical protein
MGFNRTDLGRADCAVAHEHLANHAAGRMLHLLDVGVDDHRARPISV